MPCCRSGNEREGVPLAISILLADDHPVVRQGLRALLDAEPDLHVVAETGDGREVLPLVHDLQPDVLVLDLVMPGSNGLDVARAIDEARVRTRIVLLSMYGNEAYVSQALQHGALAYVLKGADAADLVQAIRLAAAGQRYLSPPLSDDLIERYAQRAAPDPYDLLTPREREVLQMAADGRTTREIAARLAISPRTVEAHRANLMRKLGLRHQTQLIRYAVKRGLALDSDDPAPT